MADQPPTGPRKRRRHRSPTQEPVTRQEPVPEEPPRAPNFEVDAAPDLVDRGPDAKRDRDPICSLPEDES